MTSFNNCICIAQARVIAGRKKDSHICTIAFHEPTEQFVRFCLPFAANRAPAIKRWHRFSFEGNKDELGNDTRRETWHFGQITEKQGRISSKEQATMHTKILSQYKYEHELNESKSSVGVLIPSGPFKLWQEHLSPSDPEDAKELERQKLMEANGLWYPDFKIIMKGHRIVDGARKPFNKTVVAWDLYEAIRSTDTNPFQAIYHYKNPYFIIGNLASQRNAFIVIGILSAPDGLIDRQALTQQLCIAP